MNQVRKRERTAIEAVARHFSATWGGSEAGSDAHLLIAGKRIAVHVAIVRQAIGERTNPPKPRLRFDKVARRLVARLQAAVSKSVPDGTTVLFTITAPIRVAAKTAEVLEDTIRAQLARRTTPVPYQGTIHGNQIGIRLVHSGSRQISKVIGLVHNPESDPGALLHLMHTVLALGEAAAETRRRAKSAKPRWLVVVIEGGSSPIESYRQIYAELSIPTCFTKILLVFAQDRVETLVG